MSKARSDQDAPDDIEIDEEAQSALHEGFLQLETPKPNSPIEIKVKQELTSGTDFDPLHRQILRRVVWTAAPAVAAFLVATGVLALRSVPRIPLTRWAANQKTAFPKPDVSALDKAYTQLAPPLPALRLPANGFKTGVKGTETPIWFGHVIRSTSESSPLPRLTESPDGFRIEGKDKYEPFWLGSTSPAADGGIKIRFNDTDAAYGNDIKINGNRRGQSNVRVRIDSKGKVTH